MQTFKMHLYNLEITYLKRKHHLNKPNTLILSNVTTKPIIIKNLNIIHKGFHKIILL